MGRVPSRAHATAEPISLPAVRPKSSDGSGTPTSPVPVISNELVGRTESVLRRAQNAMCVIAVALELEHAVDEMLEDTRSGNRAVLGHVPDEDRRDAQL